MKDEPRSSGGRNDTRLTVTGLDTAARETVRYPYEGGPASIGGYRILALLGEGGMGTVYQAEQKNPHRIVALKVIKPGVSSDQLLRRFEQEAEALGRLQHPGIAQIYEAGTAETPFGSQPFFAMEFIQGASLTDYADAHRLNARARLALMIQVCEAVEHAHQRGIIHRDLKPGNILVDQHGQPKILDFGVARVTDSDAQATRQTDMGQLVGTLAYMSPEQVLADPLTLDTRSDVYALGVVLYELLSSKLPYATHGKAIHEVVQAIREEDPAPLSSFDRFYRGDVDTIVAKALEKDKERRYASAAELAGDIRRHLADEPLVARPPSAAYQLQKFARRHKALVAGTAAVFLALIAGLIASTWEAVRARVAERTAVEQRQRADREAAAANAVRDFLANDVLAQASAAKQSSASVKPDPEMKVRTALDRAATRIQGRFDQQPEVEGAIQDTIGQTYYELGLYPEARRHLDRALDLHRRVLGVENPKTATTMSRLGRTVWLQGQYAEAETILVQAVDLQRRVLGLENRDTLYSMNNLANAYRSLGKDAQAEALYGQTLELRRRVLGPDDPDTLTSMNNLANVYWSQGKYARAEALYKQAMDIQRRVLGPEHPSTLLTMGNLADTYGRQEKYAQAEQLFVQTLEIAGRVLGPTHPMMLGFLTDSASMYERQGKYALAQPEAEQALAGKRRALGSENPETMEAAADLALIYVSLARFRDSEALAREALTFNEKHQPDDPLRFRAESLLGASLAGEKKYSEAEPLLLEGYQGLVTRKEKMGWQGVSNLRHVDRAREWIVQLYTAWGRPEKAGEWSRK
jgi:tetratricopeptide (TPR) repeat protein/predicted Ser/Thr protein kinase